MSKTKIKSSVKAGALVNHNTTRIRTAIKAGSRAINHNLVRL